MNSQAINVTHKRSRSSVAKALLRRRPDTVKEQDSNNSSNNIISSISNDTISEEERPSPLEPRINTLNSPSYTAEPIAIAMQSSGRGHSSKLSTTSITAGRVASHHSINASTSPPSVAASIPSGHAGRTASISYSDKGAVSLEQSLRKFRIVEALRNGDTALISKAIRETSESAPRQSISSMSGGGATGPLEDTTVLHLAIQCAETQVIEYILSDGAGLVDINARDKDGNTPLHIAAQQGRTQVVHLLLEQSGINDSVANFQGRLPIDLARNPEIFQQLHLSKTLFVDDKIKQVQELISAQNYGLLRDVLEEARVKAVLDINSPDFVSEPISAQSGGTLLHEAARKRDSQLIQLLLLHGADPFKRDRRGKLPQDVTKDDTTRAMLKRSPAAQAAQRGIQEKAVLGAASQSGIAGATSDPLAGREAREMRGYLKKWTNYRKGYQLRWFVLEDGVLSYSKNQDDASSACRGAINMRIAKLHMSPDEKTKFEIIGKSSVKYTLKANHEVEAKRWFWALNNSIQWSKDQAKEEERQKARRDEYLRHVKEHDKASQLIPSEAASEKVSVSEMSTTSLNRNSQIARAASTSRPNIRQDNMGTGTGTGTSTGSGGEDDEHDREDHDNRALTNMAESVYHENDDDDDDDDYGDDNSTRNSPPSKDAFSIIVQSARLQLETMSQVNTALMAQMARQASTPPPNNGSSSSNASVGAEPAIHQALTTYDGAIRSLTGLVGDLLKIAKDRESYWQSRVDREVEMRRMWEESMAKLAREQEELETQYGQAEQKRKMTKRALRLALTAEGATGHGHAGTIIEHDSEDEAATGTPHNRLAVASDAVPRPTSSRKPPIEINLSDSDSEDEEEFYDAVDAGNIEVSQMPPSEHVPDSSAAVTVVNDGENEISSSFCGYENGLRTRLKMDEDNRPKVSLWGILKSMIGKDMTKMTLPVSFNEPTSLLYRCGEDMEYVDLLDLAANRSDSIERLIYVAAFAASEYASTIGRVAKPFNPLLGETFEYVRPDKNYRFFIEQVSHHPPIGAAWAESPRWTYYGESSVRSKFYGKSFDINPLGTWFLKLRPTSGGKEDFYTWKKVTSTVIGIITGNPTIDNYGTMEIKNWTTGEVCYLEFKPRGWKASSAYQAAGKIVDASGKVVYSMGGRWNSRLYARKTPGYEAALDDPGDGAHRGSINDPNKAFLIWQANPRPAGIPFNLTPFVLTFNHIDDQLRPWLAPTDSRLRPDQRAMEEGEYDFAASEKTRLEEAQRARRRVREQRGEEFKPAWFTKARCEISGEEYWKFSGEYWKRRERAGPNGDATVWDGLEPIYEDFKGPVPRSNTQSSM
ncbi:hypothetical protein TD95_000809 [Thielaviopsis punctulata]|uniref:PH domain-containing protein n=1 Tax=Thielaviopsis punctulata TaxID=72032 RepID=A0A0F4ZM52_9PEZI|nr:hypothetical protein TD95_000809 [Thielaviopsis punctulata]